MFTEKLSHVLVTIGNLQCAQSDVKFVESGVLQGSILGPLFFILFMNDFPLSSTLLSSILFADDTRVFDTLVFQKSCLMMFKHHIGDVPKPIFGLVKCTIKVFMRSIRIKEYPILYYLVVVLLHIIK